MNSTLTHLRSRRAAMMLALLTVLATPIFTLASSKKQKANAQKTADNKPDKVVATVGDMHITEAQVDERIKPQLAAINNQIYQIKRNAIEQIVDDYLIEQAAKKAGITKEAYLKREVEDKVKPPTDQQMQAFYNQHRMQIRQPLDKIKPQLANYMKNQDLNNQRRELMASLRKDANYHIMLTPPRVQVATTGAQAEGPANAPVTIVEFSDFQCPFCQRSETAVKEVRQKYGDKVRLVYRDFPLPMHQNAMIAAEAARCAADQGKFWQYHDALFADQTKLTSAGLKATAGKLGLDQKQFDQCLDQNKHLAAIEGDIAAGKQAGVTGTPAFFINGRPVNGAQPASSYEQVIDEELARNSSGGEHASAQ